MDIDVYCDEAYLDLLCSEQPKGNFLVIGSVWLPTERRADVKKAIHELRDKHRVGPEFKWRRVSRPRLDFYLDLVKLFFDYDDLVRFRCIAADRNKIKDLHLQNYDQEMGFYKFYYQMLHGWIRDFNSYAMFCDLKRNRVRDRLDTLRTSLGEANLASRIKNVQAIKSEESVLIQMTDVFTGAVAARMNSRLVVGGVKEQIVVAIEESLGRPIGHFSEGERKFNVTVIDDLEGGW